MSQLVSLPPTLKPFLSPHLPQTEPSTRPFITLTYAASLDSRIAAKPGVQTAISHLETKTMTHYIRSKHDAILIGSGTAISDDPGLNCRYIEDGKSISSPQPIIIDPNFKWNFTQSSRVIQTAKEGKGKAPWIIVKDSTYVDPTRKSILTSVGGKIIRLSTRNNRERLDWEDIFMVLHNHSISSIMVEGGATVINELLTYRMKDNTSIIDSLIITIGPVFLGNEGVMVSPANTVNLQDVSWWRGVQDSVLTAHVT